jgi:diacylglycerol kinase (ATP)
VQRQVMILWNGKSGNARQRGKLLDELEDLRRHDVELEERFPKSIEEAIAAAQAAPEETIVVAAGGDGTVHAIAHGIIERQIAKQDRSSSDGAPDREEPSGPALAVLPMGTANDFVRSLGIEVDPSAALAAVKQPKRRQLDAVRFSVDGRREWMINVAAGGNAAEVSRRLDSDQKKQWGPWSYIGGAVDVVGEMQSFPIELRLDDAPPREFNCLNLIFANGRSAATLEVASQANLEDGLLEVAIVLEGTFMETAQVAADFFTTDYLQSEKVYYRRAKRVLLESRRRICFSIDGEIHWGRSFAFEVYPAVLSAVVGEGYPVEPARKIPLTDGETSKERG